MLRRLGLLLVGLCLAPGWASAELLVVEFNSSVTYTQNLPVLGLSPALGAPVSGYFCYDTTAADSYPIDPTNGTYSTGHLTVSIDGHRIDGDLPTTYVWDLNAPNDLFGCQAGSPLGTAPLQVDGQIKTNGYIGLAFSEESGTVLNSDALPSAALLVQLPVSQFYLVQPSSGGVVSFDNVTITSIHVADPVVNAVDDVGNDQGRQVRLYWDRCSFDKLASLRPITQYAIFRHVESGLKAPDLWDYVGSVPAFNQLSYSAVVPTLCDTTPVGDCNSTFIVRAMTASPSVFIDSAAAMGASVDNLAPSIPLNLTLAPSGLLAWTESSEPDFNYYAIYASADALLDPGDSILGYATTPQFDVFGSSSAYFLVSATDFASNEGAAAAIANGSVVPAPAALPARLTLSSIWPNPARGVTNITYALPQSGQVEAAVFDAAGRRVRGLGTSRRDAGSNLLAWDGRDESGREVAAGVYFVRIRVGVAELAARVLRIR